MMGEKLRELRKNRYLTLEELAVDLTKIYKDKEKPINFSKGKLSKWENEKDEPRLPSLKAIADYFGVSVDYLMNTTPNDLNLIYNQLEQERQKEVFNYANHQLQQQNKQS